MSMNFGKLNFAVGFNRTSAFPIDANGYFENFEAAQAAALTAADVGSSDSAYYFGQLIAVVLDKVANIYVITKGEDGRGTLEEVGSATLGDDETIDLDVDTKKLSLHDFGKYYYAFSSDSEGNTHYTKTAITESNKAKLAGLEARIVLDGDKYVLGWYEPNTTTVEGVSKELASLKTTVQEQSNLLTGDTTVDGSVNKRIADAIKGVQQFKYLKVDALPETGEAGTIYLKKHVVGEGETQKTHYDEYLWFADGGWEEIGALDDVDLSNYYTKNEADTAINNAVKVEHDRATAAESGLSDRIKTIEDIHPQANTIENIGIKTAADGEFVNVPISAGKQAQIDLTSYATKTELSNQKTALEGQISTTKTNLETAISTAQSNAESTAKSYTDTEIGKVNNELGAVKTSIGTVPEGSTVIAEIGKKVSTTDFETFKTDNTAAINKAKEDAVKEAGTSADTKISTATGDLGTKEVEGQQVKKTVKEYVDEAVRAAKPSDYETVKADVAANKTAIAAINNEQTGILAQAKADSTSKVDALKGGDTDAPDAVTVSNAIKKANAAQTAADSKVSAVKGDKSITATKGDANTEYTVAVKISKAEGNLLQLADDGLKVIHEDAPEYSLVKAASATTGYAATYNLTKAGSIVGESINIPKDYIVKSAELKICEEINVPQQGFAIGDKYIDFTVNTIDGTAGTTGEKHIYLNVKDLVDVYTAGTGIDISKSNVVSVKVVAENGLSVDANGIKVSTAGKDAEGEGYHAGTMSAEDAQKLAGIAAGAQVNKIESITVGGTELPISEKKVAIPMATATALGLVKSSTGANHVTVGEDGTMTVASVNASTLVSDAPIRINGGNATSDFSSLKA